MNWLMILIDKLKNGVWSLGRVAYRKQELDVNEV